MTYGQMVLKIKNTYFILSALSPIVLITLKLCCLENKFKIFRSLHGVIMIKINIPTPK